jgi:hypothetical protein
MDKIDRFLGFLTLLILLAGIFYVTGAGDKIINEAKANYAYYFPPESQDVSVNIVVTDSSAKLLPDDGSMNICETLLTNYPESTFIEEQECIAAGGEYKCDATGFACYNIQAFNAASCGYSTAQQLKAYCASRGGVWTCSTTEISCEVQ